MLSSILYYKHADLSSVPCSAFSAVISWFARAAFSAALFVIALSFGVAVIQTGAMRRTF